MNGRTAEDADPYLPRHGDLHYSVDEYDLELDYKVETNRLAGQAKLTCVATEDLRRFTLDLAGLQVSKLTVNGASVKFSSQRNKIIAGLRSTVPAGDQFVVKVSYRGSPKPMAGPDGEAGWEELTDGVVVASQPHGAPSWFPCNDHPADKARYRIAVTAESAYHVVANGRLISRHRHASKTTWEYRQDQPMAPYLATVQIGRYAERAQLGAAVPIRLIFQPRSAARVTAAFADQASMVNFFTGLFGDYPYDDYAVVVTADDLEIPVEAQGLSIFGSNFLKLDWDCQRLIAHELAHQWFGNSLTVKHWRDIWLNEGFACYSEWLWSEESGGPSAQAKAMKHWRRLKGLPQDLRLADPGAESMFDDRVYKRGALLLHSLRRTIGDDSFFGLLRTWVTGHQHGLVTTKEFVELATEVGGDKASDLLQAWLFELPLPDLPD